MEQMNEYSDLSQILAHLCEDISHVYHLNPKQAKTALMQTHFYKCLTNPASSLWKSDPDHLFLLYQDEVEYGRLLDDPAEDESKKL
ncbi:MAG: hypothetical protein ACI4F1_12370 [Bariatricus sp.]